MHSPSDEDYAQQLKLQNFLQQIAELSAMSMHCAAFTRRHMSVFDQLCAHHKQFALLQNQNTQSLESLQTQLSTLNDNIQQQRDERSHLETAINTAKPNATLEKQQVNLLNADDAIDCENMLKQAAEQIKSRVRFLTETRTAARLNKKQLADLKDKRTAMLEESKIIHQQMAICTEDVMKLRAESEHLDFLETLDQSWLLLGLQNISHPTLRRALHVRLACLYHASDVSDNHVQALYHFYFALYADSKKWYAKYIDDINILKNKVFGKIKWEAATLAKYAQNPGNDMQKTIIAALYALTLDPNINKALYHKLALHYVENGDWHALDHVYNLALICADPELNRGLQNKMRKAWIKRKAVYRSESTLNSLPYFIEWVCIGTTKIAKECLASGQNQDIDDLQRIISDHGLIMSQTIVKHSASSVDEKYLALINLATALLHTLNYEYQEEAFSELLETLATLPIMVWHEWLYFLLGIHCSEPDMASTYYTKVTELSSYFMEVNTLLSGTSESLSANFDPDEPTPGNYDRAKIT